MSRFAKGARLDPKGHRVTSLRLHPGLRRVGGPLPTSARVVTAPVMDQGATSSCVAHAVSAAISPALGFVASQSFAYKIARLVELSDQGAPRSLGLQDGGSSPNELARALPIYGVEARGVSADYDARNSDADPSTINVLPHVDDYEAGGRHLVFGQYAVATEDEVLIALGVLGKPVTCTTFADTRFDNWDPASGPVGVPDLRDTNGGYHALVIVGYHTVAGKIVFDIQNSWSDRWGSAGLFQASEAWFAQTADRYVWDARFQEAA